MCPYLSIKGVLHRFTLVNFIINKNKKVYCLLIVGMSPPDANEIKPKPSDDQNNGRRRNLNRDSSLRVNKASLPNALRATNDSPGYRNTITLIV